MANELQIFREYIKKNGLKDTPQREEILNYLLRAEKHLTPEEIFQSLRQMDPKLGRATVFRTLKLLEDSGLASRVTFADGRQKYESIHDRPHHDHMICVQCGEALEFSSPAVERIQDQIAKKNGFKILWHRHEVFGRCRRCEKQVSTGTGVNEGFKNV
jgi:Fur family transcriptional regulator, ferric uptake regulator